MDSECISRKKDSAREVLHALIFADFIGVKQEFPPAHQFGMPTFAKHLGMLFKMLPAAFDLFDELRRRHRFGLPANDPPNIPDEFEALRTRQWPADGLHHLQ